MAQGRQTDSFEFSNLHYFEGEVNLLMMDKRPILSIAIPTYNRVNNLKQALSKVLEYTKGMDIEIFISDNASTDETQAYVQEIRQIYPYVGYYRNEANLGLDGNFLNCFNKAKGKYLLMLSDDDILLPGAIEDIFIAIKSNPVFIHLNNYWVHDKSTSRFPERGIVYYSDKNDYLEMMGIFITFTSTLVYNVDLVRQVVDKKRFYGENLLLSHVALETMRNSGKYALITRNCLDTPTSPLSYDLYKTWIYGFEKLIIDTGNACGFDKRRLERLLYHKFKWEILDMVIYWKTRNVDISKWNQKYLWPVISKYQKLNNLYEKVIKSTKTTTECIWQDIQNDRLYDLTNFCRGYSHNYIYGIGYNAEIIYQFLTRNNINIDGAIISDGQEKKPFYDIPVYFLFEIEHDINNKGIILTPNKQVQSEIALNLKSKGCIYNVYEHGFFVMFSK